MVDLGWIAQGWVKITQDSTKFGFRYDPPPPQKKKNNFGLILFVHNLITGCSK